MPIRAWAGLVIVCSFVLVAILAPLLTPYSPHHNGGVDERLAPPFWHKEGTLSNPLGTDHLARDVWTWLVYGARHSLVVTLGALVVGGALGTTVGLIFGRFRGPWDYIYDRFRPRFGVWLLVMLIPFSFLLVHYSGKRQPLVLIASILYFFDVAGTALLLNLIYIGLIYFAVVLGVDTVSLILAIGMVAWGPYAKDIRSAVMRSTPSESIVQDGLARFDLPVKSPPNTLTRVFRTLAAMTISQAGFLMTVEFFMSFAGAAGVFASTASWGNMVGSRLSTEWWVWAPPIVCITLTVLGFYMLGNWLSGRLRNSLAAL